MCIRDRYVDNTTFYFTADGQNYHCDIGNLDPNASYRVTISYDSSRYYLYGLMLSLIHIFPV